MPHSLRNKGKEMLGDKRYPHCFPTHISLVPRVGEGNTGRVGGRAG